jgi:hypothetical protein
VLADSLACLCCSWVASPNPFPTQPFSCLRPRVLDALAGLLQDEACGVAAQGLVSAVKGGLVPWLMSGAEPDQVRHSSCFWYIPLWNDDCSLVCPCDVNLAV